jgi:histidinol dehydrogenase
MWKGSSRTFSRTSVKNGDKALFAYTERFDRAKLTSLAVTKEEIAEAVAQEEPAFLDILRRAAGNIRKFHSRQVRNSFLINDESGIVIGQKIIPIERAGLYVPGGTAAYPSTVLMDAIPAKIAGCREVVMVTPPGADGKINPAILAAASVAGVDRIFKVGRRAGDRRAGVRNRIHSQGRQDCRPGETRSWRRQKSRSSARSQSI